MTYFYIKKLRKLIVEKWFGGSVRSVLVKKQAVYSLLGRFVDGGIAFILVRETLTYLNEYEYGLWITLSSVLSWINSCDIGLGNGLKNKLGKALALDDKLLARCYVSTAWVAVALIALLLLVIYSAFSFFLDWNIILNAKYKIDKLNIYVWIFFVLFLMNFVSRLVNTVYLIFRMKFLVVLKIIDVICSWR